MSCGFSWLPNQSHLSGPILVVCHSLRGFSLSDRDPDALASLCREGNQQVPHMIHISLFDGIVESQCWLSLFPGPIVEVVLAEDASEDQIKLCVCQVDSALGSGSRTFSTLRMQIKKLTPHTSWHLWRRSLDVCPILGCQSIAPEEICVVLEKWSSSYSLFVRPY